MAKTLKTAAIPRAGLEYQDLLGIEKLLDYFRNRDKYLWIQLESEDRATGYLDDVVAALADGSFELIQVKYTADPSENTLGWDWLLKKKGRGTSLLQKWSRTVKGFAGGPISLACLQTSREPDREFATTLNADGIADFDKLAEPRKAEVTQSIGTAFEARKFFSQFRFFHSRPILDDLEDDLRSSIVPTETDTVGWSNLRTQARRWAMHKCEPEPDGHITHQHLTQIITKVAPRPMPQSFAIPKGYTVPRQSFHDSFLSRVTKPSGITVLWGTPGRGKSTYLSFLANELRKADIPIVRHHYFLSLHDTTTNRHAFPNIAHSLMEQMVVHHPDAVKGLEEEANQLPKWLAQCGEYFAEVGKPFVVIIDGLDHVWREQRNLTQLDHLFDNLLPCAPNVNLIVGTQKISNDKLPAKLIRRLKKQDWFEIPSMDEASVHSWVKQQYRAKRLRLPKPRFRESVDLQVGTISRAFFDISSGHPLHLIYSFEALVRRGGYVDEEAIRLLPQCPDGDINAYYETLWAKLSENARKIVHLIAGSDFRWPLAGVVKYFGQIDEISFLLEQRRTGLIPFHGSILAFVRAREDHEAVFASLLPRVRSWLKHDAPEYVRWGWEWLIQARSGNYQPLLLGANRNWAVASLSAGWPPEQVMEILAVAETKVFEGGDYAKTIRYRSLKTRVSNGEEYQIDDFPLLREIAISSARNEQILDVLADGLSTLSEREILMLSRCAQYVRPGFCGECLEELVYRVNLWVKLRHRPTEEFIAISKYLAEAAARVPSFKVDRILNFIFGFKDGSPVFSTLVGALEVCRRTDGLRDLLSALEGKKRDDWSRQVLDALIRSSSVSGIDVTAVVAASTSFPLSAFSACWCFYHKVPVSCVVSPPQRSPRLSGAKPRYEQENLAEPYLYELFFHTLYGALNGQSFSILPKENEFIDRAIGVLEGAARQIALGSLQLSFAAPYFAASALEVPDDEDYSSSAHMHHIELTNALRRISIDLHFIKLPAGTFAPIRADELRYSRASKHWVEELWLDKLIEANYPLQSIESATETLEREIANVSSRVTQFNERATKWVQLARYAALFKLPNASLVARAVECTIGYGWRKDLWLGEVLECVALVHEHGAAQGLPMLRKLVPIVEVITEFTDGDETDHVRSELIETVAKVSPSRLPLFYEHHVSEDEFRYADDALRWHMKVSTPGHPAAQGLIRTLVESADISTLESLAKQSPDAARLVEGQLYFLGGKPPKPKEYASAPDKYDRIGTPPDVKKFGPDKFRKLLAATGKNLGYDHQRDSLHGWLDYWTANSRAKEALGSLRQYFDEEENTYTANSILDHAFRISLKHEGKDAAYYWLVKAHVHNHGWDRYWSSRTAEPRLVAAATHYADKWREFIADTAAPERYWLKRHHSFAIGVKSLVSFLLMVGQNAAAADFTRACIEIVTEEVRDQPIEPCGWFQ